MLSLGSVGTAIVKYQPSHGTDTLVKSGNTTNINTKQHCITAMKEYEAKSLEELRLEDYLENRKGGAQVGQATSLFSNQPANTGLVFGQHKTSGLFAPQDSINVFGNQAVLGFNETASGFGQAGRIITNLQFHRATTPTFGCFNNTTTPVINPFGQSPFKHEGIFKQTQPPISTKRIHRRLSQQGTSTFGNTDDKTYAWAGIQKQAQPSAFESFGINLAEPAQNQQPFGMSKSIFNFNTFISQQNKDFVHLPKLPLEGQSLNDALRMMP